MNQCIRTSVAIILLTAGCSDVKDHEHHDHNHGLPTTLILNFTPTDGGEAQSFTWTDPEAKGEPSIDPVSLSQTDYTLSLEIWNHLEEPAENLTTDIEDHGDEHQFFFTGDAVRGPATGEAPNAILTHTYGDEDENGLPIGLNNNVTGLKTGTGELTVTLRHMPPENDQPVKVANVAEEVANGGLQAIGGDNDLSVSFPVSID